MAPTPKPSLAVTLLAALALAHGAAPAAAQTRERGFITMSGAAQAPAGTLTDRFTYTVNVEDATTEARYPSKTGVLVDGGGGVRLWKSFGAAVSVSRSSTSGTARTDSRIPHPFFDDRDRQVSGEARGLSRTETGAHVQLYYVRDYRRWRVRLSGGPSYIHVEQEVVTGVNLDESYPYDTAAFRSAATRRGKGSAVGFNVGGDVAWMFKPRFGLGALVRFARAEVDFNVEGAHRVSTDAGGAQAGAGLRIVF